MLGHAKVGAAMLLEHVPLFERAGIEQKLNAFAGSQFALGVLGIDAFLSSTQTGSLALLCELTNDVVHGTPPFELTGTLTARAARSSMRNETVNLGQGR